jgi:hypothetical protein
MSTITIDDIIYTYGGSTAEVTSYIPGIPTANIPSTIVVSSVTYNVTSIRAYAFRNCASLTSVTIPNSVTSIRLETFYNCASLTSVTIPNSVTTIDGGVFYNCTSLTSVTIPNSVTTIGSQMFYDCTSLTSVTLPTNPLFTIIEPASFQNCASLTYITIPDSVTNIRSFAFNLCTNLNLVYFLQTSTLPSFGFLPFAGISGSSVGKYYSSVPNAASRLTAQGFASTSTISNTIPTLTSITPFTSTSTLAVAVISYANLAANGNVVTDNPPYVFLVNAVSSGSLSIGATQGTAAPWNASTNKTIDANNNAYWTPPPGGVNGLLNAFSIVVQDAVGEVSSPNVDVQVNVPYPCF